MRIRTFVIATLLFATTALQAQNFELQYQSDSGALNLVNVAGTNATTVEIKSEGGQLTGDRPAHFSGLFDVYNANKAFKLDPAGFGDIAGFAFLAPGLDGTDITVDGSLVGGGPLGDVAITGFAVAPEPVLAPYAAGILNADTPILGGVLNGDQFELGIAGTAGGANNWPGAEPPEDLINGIIGGGGEKYLNFAKNNTGVIVSPGPSTVDGIDFWLANDAEPRDPTDFILYGTNSAISGDGPFSTADFTMVASGDIDFPSVRDTVADDMGYLHSVSIDNSDTYSSYLLVFPNVKDAAAANSMQISEVQFHGEIVPEPSSLVLLIMAGFGLFMRRR